jgi:hypothetical protein
MSRSFAEDYIICREILSINNVENFQIDVNRLREWAFENEITINPAKSKAVCFMKDRVTESLNYSLADTVIPKAKSC